MEIPKPVAIAVIVLVLVGALAVVWYLASGSGSTGGAVPESAYPKAQTNQPGVEAFGVQPPDNRAAPATSLPLETGGKR